MWKLKFTYHYNAINTLSSILSRNPWSFQPTLYKSTWQRVAAAVQNGTQYATMLWSPAGGFGYPFAGGQYSLQCDTHPDDCAALDTNGDGNVTQADDMFDPFWPGPDSVDWVGMAVFWWGVVSYPFIQHVYYVISRSMDSSGYLRSLIHLKKRETACVCLLLAAEECQW